WIGTLWVSWSVLEWHQQLEFRSRPESVKTRNGYSGGASQFDAIAIETLAVLGLRPRELIQAKPDAIVEKTDVQGRKGVYFRIVRGKNKAAERDVPLSDGVFEAVNISRLREMLVWQDNNTRDSHGAVSSLSTRFRKVTEKYTPYQMRHSWKDLALDAGIDFEIRERIVGHRVKGVASIYGSGIPLKQGLAAIQAVSNAIWKAEKQIS
ncbi:hypothetical protein, partial [Acidovorax sp.]|uniref:hypothetical protein n=1 Tax=Acidovorax sp. TaxID=1872122 RepID=UPI0025BE90E7